jgi:hypothetical protein
MFGIHKLTIKHILLAAATQEVGSLMFVSVIIHSFKNLIINKQILSTATNQTKKIFHEKSYNKATHYTKSQNYD